MARTSFGPNRAATWAVTQKPRPMPRVVRLGRPANDNHSPHAMSGLIGRIALGATLLALVVCGVRLV